eukprot:921478-Prorocentrum_minimum.AAC.1
MVAAFGVLVLYNKSSGCNDDKVCVSVLRARCTAEHGGGQDPRDPADVGSALGSPRVRGGHTASPLPAHTPARGLRLPALPF